MQPDPGLPAIRITGCQEGGLEGRSDQRLRGLLLRFGAGVLCFWSHAVPRRSRDNGRILRSSVAQIGASKTDYIYPSGSLEISIPLCFYRTMLSFCRSASFPGPNSSPLPTPCSTPFHQIAFSFSFLSQSQISRSKAVKAYFLRLAVQLLARLAS